MGLGWRNKPIVPIVIRRQKKEEAEQAIRDLEERGFEVVFPLKEFFSAGKNFDTDEYNRKIFVENSSSSCWMAKLSRVK